MQANFHIIVLQTGVHTYQLVWLIQVQQLTDNFKERNPASTLYKVQ